MQNNTTVEGYKEYVLSRISKLTDIVKDFYRETDANLKKIDRI